MGRFWLYITSLSPAILIFSIRLIPHFLWYAVVGILVSLLLFPAAYWLLSNRRNISAEPVTPLSVYDESGQIPTYLITFIFPFLFVSDTPSPYTIIAYVVFAVFMLALLFRSDVAVVNPALLIAGYHVYTVETASGSIYVISRKCPVVNTTFNAHPVSGNLYLQSKD